MAKALQLILKLSDLVFDQPGLIQLFKLKLQQLNPRFSSLIATLKCSFSLLQVT